MKYLQYSRKTCEKWGGFFAVSRGKFTFCDKK